ncbi:hypothetical protein SHIRM173S_01070 [Streptomyces hirsutus]
MSAPFPYQLVATDLDGTLLRDDHSVSRRTRDALAAATAAGASHIVVTGRAVPWTRPILDDLGFHVHFTPTSRLPGSTRLSGGLVC